MNNEHIYLCRTKVIISPLVIIRTGKKYYLLILYITQYSRIILYLYKNYNLYYKLNSLFKF